MTENFKTSDLYLCAAMLSLGAKLEDVDREDTRHMVFELSSPPNYEVVVFVNPSIPTKLLNLSELENQWTNKTLMVNAFDYSEAMKRMKSVVHSR